MKRQIVIAVSAITFISLLIVFVIISGDENETNPGKMPPPSPQLEKFDSDKDGSISEDEWMSHFNNIFSQFDADGDEIGTKEEISSFHESNPSKQGPGPMKMKMPPVEFLINFMDKNNDKAISKDEWENHHRTLFSKLDRNENSIIEKEEIQLPPGARRMPPPPGMNQEE